MYYNTATDLSSRLENAAREKMRHLRALCFVRPSADSVQLLIDELRDPKYGEYYICEQARPYEAHADMHRFQ
jgi:hypothetical protein